jgi:hypothetical protein
LGARRLEDVVLKAEEQIKSRSSEFVEVERTAELLFLPLLAICFFSPVLMLTVDIEACREFVTAGLRRVSRG